MVDSIDNKSSEIDEPSLSKRHNQTNYIIKDDKVESDEVFESSSSSSGSSSPPKVDFLDVQEERVVLLESIDENNICFQYNRNKENLLKDYHSGKNRKISTKSFNIRKMSTWTTKNGFKDDLMGFQNLEKQKKKIRRNLKLNATLLFIGVVITTALALIDTQISESLKHQKTFYKQRVRNFSLYNISANVLKNEKEKIKFYRIIELSAKSTISLITIASITCLYIYYCNLLTIKKIRNFYPIDMGFFRATPLVKKLAIECFIVILHVPPYANEFMGIPTNLQIIVFLRLYLIGRYLKEKHELMNSQSTRFLASVTKTELTSMFLFKTFFMQYPFQLILLAYFIILFIGGYGVWLIEKGDYTYLDTVWMLIITMTTVGFGDLTPKTMLGRFTVGLAAIIGIFLMALFISLVNEALMLQRREKRILSYVETQDMTRQKKVSAVNAIVHWYRYHVFVNNNLKYETPKKQYFIGDKTYRRRPDLITIAHAKILESRMIKNLNIWRKVREAQPAGYFAQEFMIEDMKIMMNDLKEKSENLERDMETVTKNMGKFIKEKEKEKHAETPQIIYSNLHIEKPCYQRKEKHIFAKEPRMQTKADYCFEQDNTWMHQGQFIPNKMHINKTYQNNNNVRYNQNNNNGKTKCSRLNKNGKSDIRIAYKLLQNQAKIMNNALDDIYFKTRQDICDLENLIKSLLVCSEKDDSSDRYPTKEDEDFMV